MVKRSPERRNEIIESIYDSKLALSPHSVGSKLLLRDSTFLWGRIKVQNNIKVENNILFWERVKYFNIEEIRKER